MKRNGTVIASVSAVLVASGLCLLAACGGKTPLESTEEGASYTARVEIHPPSFDRNEATQSFFNEEITLSVPLHLDDEVGDGHTAGEDLAEAKEHAAFERIIDGIRIQLGVEEAKHMVLWHDGAWEEHHAEADEHHIELVLEDPNVDAHASKILYSDVVLAVAKDGIALSSTSLTPMYTSHGFHYGGNFGLAEAGDYQITVTAGTPTFARSESTQDKWKQPISVTFEYSFAGGPLTEEIEIGEIETQGLKVELEAKGPERMWMQMAGDSHWIEPATGATHHFEVKLEDPAVDAHAEFIGYAEIHVTIVNDATGEESGEIELHPMYGDHGLHYGANFHLPDGHDEPDDDDHHNE